MKPTLQSSLPIRLPANRIRHLISAALLALPLVAAATEYRVIDHPRQECWNEQVAVRGNGNGYGGAIVGGLAGGLLGNQVGGGNGRTVATAVGAATGAVVGDRMSSNQPGYQTVQRCRTVIDQQRIAIEPDRRYYSDDDEHEYKHKYKHKHKHHEHDDDDD